MVDNWAIFVRKFDTKIGQNSPIMCEKKFYLKFKLRWPNPLKFLA